MTFLYYFLGRHRKNDNSLLTKLNWTLQLSLYYVQYFSPKLLLHSHHVLLLYPLPPPCSLSPVELSDLILYMSDITSTLKAFLDVYPLATEALMHGEFVETLVAFYESVVPVLQTRWLEVYRDVSEYVNLHCCVVIACAYISGATLYTSTKPLNHHCTFYIHVHTGNSITKHLVHSSASFVKARFRNFKKDSTWIVNSILRLYFNPSFIEAGESSQIPLDSFISAVTTVLTEKRWATVNTRLGYCTLVRVSAQVLLFSAVSFVSMRSITT